MNMVERFAAHWRSLGIPPTGALVAVSGGSDSVALLDLLGRTPSVHGLELAVAHVDHGIHPDSAAVASEVAALAAELECPYLERTLSLGAGASETAARTRRYRALHEMRRETGATLLLTAHQADDQAETVLMRVLKGTGPAGLAGIRPKTGRLVRPLLPFRRAELVRHLQGVGRRWWADPANEDASHLRSWLRTDILAELSGRMPRVIEDLARVGRQAAVNRAAWDSLVDRLPGLAFRAEESGGSVAAGVLGDYDRTLGTCAFQAVARRVGCHLGTVRAQRGVRFARQSQSGQRLELGNGWIVERAFDRIRLVRESPEDPVAAMSLEADRGSAVWGEWSLRWQRDRAPATQPREGLRAWFPAGALVVRPPRAGERIRPLGGRGRRLIVRCLQEARVPRSRRSRWPVVEVAGEVAWVPGVMRSAVSLPAEGMEAVRVDVEQH